MSTSITRYGPKRNKNHNDFLEIFPKGLPLKYHARGTKQGTYQGYIPKWSKLTVYIYLKCNKEYKINTSKAINKLLRSNSVGSIALKGHCNEFVQTHFSDLNVYKA